MSWILLLLVSLAALDAWLRRLPDARIRLLKEKARNLRVDYPDPQHARLRWEIPFRNEGTQQGLLIDASARLQPLGERYSDLQPVCRLTPTRAPRADGYWEAVIVPIGEELEASIELWLTAEDAREAVARMGEVRIEILFKSYCRTPMKYRREELVHPISRFVEVSSAPLGEEAPPPAPTRQAPDPRAQPREGRVLPLRTHLLRPDEDVVEVTARYLDGVGRPGDLVALAETAVAIMQGRLAYCEDIQPRFLARRLNRLFGMHSSLSSVYAMEMAFREVGTPRILLATAAALVGKALGRQGDFYRIAGREVATIDDCTGTLPPFDKHVVLGPADGPGLVARIKARTGLDAAIVDANDLGKVDVLAISEPSRTAEVVEALRPNPQGNAGEMTPLVLIRGGAPEPAGPPA